MAIAELVRELYAEQPTSPLFHYTSLRGLLGIVRTRAIQAADVHFFNDAAEMSLTAELLRDAIGRRNEIGRRSRADEFTTRLRSQLRDWLRHRLSGLGHAVFVANRVPRRAIHVSPVPHALPSIGVG